MNWEAARYNTWVKEGPKTQRLVCGQSSGNIYAIPDSADKAWVDRYVFDGALSAHISANTLTKNPLIRVWSGPVPEEKPKLDPPPPFTPAPIEENKEDSMPEPTSLEQAKDHLASYWGEFKGSVPDGASAKSAMIVTDFVCDKITEAVPISRMVLGGPTMNGETPNWARVGVGVLSTLAIGAGSFFAPASWGGPLRAFSLSSARGFGVLTGYDLVDSLWTMGKDLAIKVIKNNPALLKHIDGLEDVADALGADAKAITETAQFEDQFDKMWKAREDKLRAEIKAELSQEGGE